MSTKTHLVASHRLLVVINITMNYKYVSNVMKVILEIYANLAIMRVLLAKVQQLNVLNAMLVQFLMATLMIIKTPSSVVLT